MHAMTSKSVSKDRELSPRYYYKLSEKVSCCEKIKKFFRLFFTFLFTQVGVIVLISSYMLSGAAMFHNIEHDSLMQVAHQALAARRNASSHMWRITLVWNNNVSTHADWRSQTCVIIADFQRTAVERVREGYTGRDPGERVWTFSSSLMFSLAIFTTIGYGNLVPKTTMGKIVTMLYALLGIPLMLLYSATIGSILAKFFKYLYTKLCRCEEKPTDLPKKATLPSIQTDTMSIAEEDFNPGASYTKISRNSSFRFDASNPPPPPPPPQPGVKKEKPSLLRSLVSNLKHKSEEDQTSSTSSVLERMTSKSSRKSGLSVSNMDNTVKFKLVEDLSLVTIPITTCLLVLLGYILLGAALFSAWEGWTILDGAYFCFTSLMTIGFGDFVPGNSYIYSTSDSVSQAEGNAKMILGSIYLLLGLAIIAMCFNLMQEKVFAQIQFIGQLLGFSKSTGEEDL